MSVSREKLYEEVWAESMVQVAKRYKVSSNFLARVCERLNVPHPARGYWAKLQFGRAPKRPPLPEAGPGDETMWIRSGEELPVLPPRPPDLTATKPVRLPSERPSRHPLIAEAKGQFDIGKTLESGFFKPAKRSLPDVVASKETMSLALKVANELYLTLEDRGYPVVFVPRDQRLRRIEVRPDDFRQYQQAWSPERATIVYVGTVAFGLTIFELTEQAEVEWIDGKYVRTARRGPKPRPIGFGYGFSTTREMPNGKICVRAYSPYPYGQWKREWPDVTAGVLSITTADIAVELEREAPVVVKLLEEGEREAKAEKEKWEAEVRKLKREELNRRRAAADKESRDDLLEIVKEWSLAKSIEEFFQDAERRSAKRGGQERAAIAERLKRARELLGGLDALERFQSWKTPEECRNREGFDAFLEDQAPE